ncbi:unnamed protein product, partial [Musa textilis]
MHWMMDLRPARERLVECTERFGNICFQQNSINDRYKFIAWGPASCSYFG